MTIPVTEGVVHLYAVLMRMAGGPGVCGLASSLLGLGFTLMSGLLVFPEMLAIFG